jgi:hypothetical protein
MLRKAELRVRTGEEKGTREIDLSKVTKRILGRNFIIQT